MTRQERAEARFEQIKEKATMVTGGRTWFYVYTQDSKYGETWGMFFPSTGMDLWFTENQAEQMREFFKLNLSME